jgi:SecD/SecF fusion protein
MQNKGLITLFAILFGLVSLYQLSYTYLANTVEDSATQYANAKFTKDQPNNEQLQRQRILIAFLVTQL